MKLILNVIWLVLCGWWMAILYALAGIVAFILIITIPFGIAAFRIAGYVLWPFGRSVVRCAGTSGIGVADRQHHLDRAVRLGTGDRPSVSGVLLCLTIIGIPLGLANFKLIPISLLPLGTKVVRSDELYPGYAGGQPADYAGQPRY